MKTDVIGKRAMKLSNTRSYLTVFFRLLDCQIEPIVLMDGSFETAKKQTLFQRARDQGSIL